MKKLVLLLIVFTAGYAQEINFKGTIQNNTVDSLIVTSLSGKWHKAFALDKKGNFAGTLQQGIAFFYLDYNEHEVELFLQNDNDLTITADAHKFIETLKFEGMGDKENNLLADMARDKNKLVANFKSTPNKDALDKAITVLFDKWEPSLKDSSLNVTFRQLLTFRFAHTQREDLAADIESDAKTDELTGQKSPAFAYENFKGGITKLSDLKGKLVYIDVWATWCGPCRQEIPHLKKLEELYKGKNIVFVSISIDTAKDHEKWKAMIMDKALGGIQLFADNDWKSEFIKAFGIDSIPRFILIDPQGKVVNADAKRPSEPELQLQLNKLLK